MRKYNAADYERFAARTRKMVGLQDMDLSFDGVTRSYHFRGERKSPIRLQLESGPFLAAFDAFDE